MGNENQKKHKKFSDAITYAYLRKIKKWMFCPNCQDGKMTIDKKSTIWTCNNCGIRCLRTSLKMIMYFGSVTSVAHTSMYKKGLIERQYGILVVIADMKTILPSTM